MHDLERNETTVLGVVQDITAHQNDLRKHKENELLLRGVMDFATTAIALDRDGLYLHFNPYSEAAYGFSIDGARGKPAGDFYPPEVAQVLLGHDRAVVETKQVIKREQIVPTLNGGRLVLGDGFQAAIHLRFGAIRNNLRLEFAANYWTHQTSDFWRPRPRPAVVGESFRGPRSASAVRRLRIPLGKARPDDPHVANQW